MTPSKEKETTLNIYLFYRLTLSLALVSLFFIDQSFQIRAHFQSSEFLYCSIAYLFFCGLSLSLKNSLGSENKRYIYSIIFIDILCIASLHYFAGGMVSGISILLFFPVAASAIFFLGVAANFTAAVASLAILISSYYEVFFYHRDQSELVSSGILGLALFATSILVQRLAQNIRTTQAELEEQSDEINYLELLNQHIVKRLRTGIVVFNSQGKIKLANDSAHHLLGDDFFLQTTISGAFALQYQQWQSQTSSSNNSFQQQPGLADIQINFISNHIGKNNNDIIAFIENTTELSQQAQQIKLASLGRLSASIAHEIRNPLSAISHSTQLLNESEHIDSSDARLLEIINTHIKRLNNIIDNILSISKRHKPNITTLNLEAFIEEICHHHLAKFTDAIEITNSVKAGIQSIADKSQMSQVVTNLLENALHYSHEASGNYWAKVQISQDQDERGIVRIFDRGPGISTENIDKVFEPFFTTRKSGTGLGLFIAKELCELNHAELNYVKNDQQAYFQIRFAHAKKTIY